jgi:small subunit ribosomal protein S6
MAQNCYDIVIIIDPKLTENNIKDLITKAKKVISSAGGEILTEDNWGIKRTFHPIKKNRDGFYYFLKAKIDGSKIKEIRYNLKVTEGILRATLVKSIIEVVK